MMEDCAKNNILLLKEKKNYADNLSRVRLELSKSPWDKVYKIVFENA